MGLLKTRQADPISERSRALNAQIAALEAEIRQLGSQPHPPPTQRRRPMAPASARTGARQGAARPQGPVFEPVDQERVTAQAEPASTPGHFNDLGVRKFDLAAAWRRLSRQFQGPASPNPRLINYLAAGSLNGLRPLRYEKRVARNRVIAMTVILVVVVWGILSAIHRH
jgi:hypothetical protein